MLVTVLAVVAMIAVIRKQLGRGQQCNRKPHKDENAFDHKALLPISGFHFFSRLALAV
jgi:hypothetical protein